MSGIEKEINLRQFTYHGIVLKNKDIKKQGRYKIHIPELHTLIKTDSGIWCKNQQHLWRWTPSHDYMYGEYFPLQPGTKVLIRFYENDFHSGYVDRILSDQVMNTTPKIGCKLNPEAIDDRDDVYMLYKTPKKHNLFVILEDTKDSKNGLTQNLIPNSIHLYYNYRRTTMILNQDGIHWFTMDNRGVTVEGHNSEWVNKSEKIYVKDTRDVYVNGSRMYTYVTGDEHRMCRGERRDFSLNLMSFVSATRIAEDAPTIWLNSGKSRMAKQAKVNKGEDQIVKQNKIDMRVIAHQNKNDTYYGIDKYKIEGGSPIDSHPNPTAVRLSKGMNDRHSSVGASQCGAPITVPPPYPPAIGGGGGGSSDSMSSAISNMYSNSSPSILNGSSTSPSVFNNIPGGANSVIGGVTGGIQNSIVGLSSNGLPNNTSPFVISNTLENMNGVDANNLINLGGLNSVSDLDELGQVLGGSSGIANLSNGIGNDAINRAIQTGNIDNISLDINNSLDSLNLNNLNNFGLSSLQAGSYLDNVQQFTNSGIDVISNQNPVISGLGSTFSNIGTSLNNTFSSLVGNNAIDPLNSVSNSLSSSLNSLTSNSGIDSLFGNLMNSFGVDDISNNLSSQLTTLPTNLLNGTGGLDSLMNTVTSPIKSVNSLANLLSCSVEDVLGGITGTADLLNNTLNVGLGNVLNTISSGSSLLGDIFGTLDNMFLNQMSNINTNSLFKLLSSSAAKSSCKPNNYINPYNIV